MLHLRSETADAWLTHAVAHIDEVLRDHAHCELKAAVTALSFVSKYPDDPRLVSALGALARDESDHFTRAAALCEARGIPLGHPQKDPYVDELLAVVRKDSALHTRVDRLLCCAVIEGRSCERLKLLARGLPQASEDDRTLQRFYDELWREEATHHLLFIELAERSLARAGEGDDAAKAAVDARLRAIADHEAAVVARLPVRAAIH